MKQGQALIVILLVLAVALTLGLAVVSRTITEVGTATTQAESSRALSKAESGVEAALSGTVNAGVTATDYSGRQISISEPLAAGESSTIFLSDHTTNGDIDFTKLNTYSSNDLYLCWGTEIGSPVAIEASLYYKEGAAYKVKRFAYDPEGRGGFERSDAVTNCPSDHTYLYQKHLETLPAGKILLRVRLLYNGDVAHYVGVSGSTPFPIQGKNIVSTATEGNTTRKIEVFQRYPDLSPLLDSAVFSGGGLAK
ncbi:MAG: hypothetical protein Q8L51_03430 [Candidatus Amesbacteria bacterium]|nr:hypothetical protein [Candidatus Amesbacteria bacterium]